MNVMKIIRVVIVVLCLVFVSGGAQAGEEIYPARVRNICNKEYFPFVYNAIKNSRESIFVVMYLVSFDPSNTESPVFQLVSELVSAHKRGVKVRIILDRHRPRKKGDKHNAYGVNYPTYRFFKDNGVSVRFDDINVYTHNKVVVVDRKVTIIGSANWSVAALCENNESNAVIYSRAFSEETIGDFYRINKEDWKDDEKDDAAGAVSVPYSFILNKDIFGKMSGANDERSFDIYLILLKRARDGFNETVPVSYEELADELGLMERMNRTGWRRQINKTLKKLSGRYNLIELN